MQIEWIQRNTKENVFVHQNYDHHHHHNQHDTSHENYDCHHENDDDHHENCECNHENDDDHHHWPEWCLHCSPGQLPSQWYNYSSPSQLYDHHITCTVILLPHNNFQLVFSHRETFNVLSYALIFCFLFDSWYAVGQ